MVGVAFMRSGMEIGLALALLAAKTAQSQPTVPGNASPQIRKQWTLGAHLARDLESRDGHIDDTGILEYLGRIESKLSLAAGKIPIQVRLTQSSNHYVSLFPNRVLYISPGLLKLTQDEAELAGLIAHERAHAEQASMRENVYIAACALTSPVPTGWIANMRETEMRATALAIRDLQAAGYDPSGILDLFSRLSYEHPAWSRSIAPDDLLQLRTQIDEPVLRESVVDSSDFRLMQLRLTTLVGDPTLPPMPRAKPSLERP